MMKIQREVKLNTAVLLYFKRFEGILRHNQVIINF
ncbi:hypothetical protein MUGA111182_14900 [Mucilaginibacter galii]